MGKGGGGSGSAPTSTQSQVTQTNLPEYARPYYERLLNRTEAESNRSYEPYPGQRISDFAQDQSNAYSQVRGMGMPGEVDAAGQTVGSVAGYDSSYGGNQFTGGQFNSAAANHYMNPYVDSVLNRQIGRVNEQYNADQVGRDASYIKAGAFGGDRRFVSDHLAQRERDNRLQDVVAQGLNTGYTNSQGAFDRDRQAGLQAASLTDQSQRAAEASRGAAAGIRLQAGSALGGLGQQRQQMDLQRLQALASQGGQYRDLAQQSHDVGYTDFINQRDHDRQQLAFYSGILRGIPVTPQSEVTMYTPGPNQGAQLAGAGLAGLGLAKQLSS